jgi:hypothetical protein
MCNLSKRESRRVGRNEGRSSAGQDGTDSVSSSRALSMSATIWDVFGVLAR